MAGFIRRYGFYPGVEVIRQIEGVIIIDLPPPGAVNGVGVGTVAFVGEAADCGLATTYDTAGVISTKIQPTEVFGSSDLVNKIGGWDATLGEFGKSLGNLFAALRNKKFSRLIVAPVNLASAQGSRFWRQLPLCTTSTNTTPVVPVEGATISAGREFRISTGRLKVAKRVQFTNYPTIADGVGGTLATASTAVTQTFSSAAIDWSTIVRPDGNLGARKGDIIVIGNNNAGAVAPAEAGTYRVYSTPSTGHDIVIERLDGVTFAIAGDRTAIPWRLHRSPDADSAPERTLGTSTPGGYDSNDAGGFIIPIRPITNSSGGLTDGTFTAAGLLVPAVAPAALTGDSADVLSGLGGMIHPTTATAFTAATQVSNPAASAAIAALYQSAIDGLVSQQSPTRDINIVVAARKYSTIATKLKSHVLEASNKGRGRVAIISPSVQTLSVLSAVSDSDPGVGATRNERVFYAWPGVVHSVPEAVGTLIATANSDFTEDGILDDSMDHYLASLLSVLPPERNPGQASAPVPEIFSPIMGIQRGVGELGIGEYTLMRNKGIAGIRIDRTAGPIIQSGITTSLVSGETNINRRRIADFIEDSLAERLVYFSKQPLTQGLKDDAETEVVAFLNELLSPNNPAASRITQYQVDSHGGNTPELEAKGIYVIIVRVRTTPTSDFIVLQCNIGEGVVIAQAA
jgi:hypothetical protein